LVDSSVLSDAWRRYLATSAADAYAAPLRVSDLSGLPPATIVVAECDPLHDDGIRFAQGLSAAGGLVDLLEAPGLLHGFIYMDDVSEAAAQMVDRIFALQSTDESEA
jgi:acetyl esterase